MTFADVVIDISHEAVDRTFEYIIPEELEGIVKKGSQVQVPFGRGSALKKGFVINVKERAAFDTARLKTIQGVEPGSTSIESVMISLADFIRTSYGGTMNQALKTVLPVKRRSEPVIEKFVCLDADVASANAALETNERKKNVAKARLLKELISEKVLPMSMVRDRLNIAASTIRSLEKDGLIKVVIKTNLRDAVNIDEKPRYDIRLNSEQSEVCRSIWERYESKDLRPSLIRGVTGSGKTEVYIELINRMIGLGKQAIILIPEIALTYQTVLRFYRKFGNRISVIHSRLTPAQKHDQLEKARLGEVDVIIGPRSALFTPFKNLGIIIIDEEHEGTYRNENVPRYHAREVAIKRAELSGGIVVMGSATPSIESYFKAQNGRYQLYKLEKRANGAVLPDVEIVDLREELNNGRRSMVSERLYCLIEDRLSRGEQVMLFINRRGHSSFVSCRKCGKPLKCPHCDVSLKYHNNGKLMCHYCGYEMPMVKTCPECGSKYIGRFGAGTQKVEEEINNLFPQAKTLRMDLDTTKEKDGHAKILSAFANREADILIGTQMIVKGHDFANVTLVGIMAADMSLYSESYQAPERTFQLITQAAGRAGRGEKKGSVVIQTYSPDNYAIQCGAKQDYESFYAFEMDYRTILGYPPVKTMLGILLTSADKAFLESVCRQLSSCIDEEIKRTGRDIWKMGPVDPSISMINDRYRKIIYVKSKTYDDLILIKDAAEEFLQQHQGKDIQTAFDFQQ
ncbi:MAG: primosomal protein N' [Lachnospiraceae bacterium]|nr:primosomal protein N' [Lachnospiraceae bacterium]